MCGEGNSMNSVFRGTMNTSTPSSMDRSMNGLVVFLVLFVFLAVLTSGLLVCLVKIWCGQKKTCRQTAAEQRQSVAGCSMQDSESDDEAQPPILAPAVRRFSQRIISLVQRGPDRRPTITTRDIAADRCLHGSCSVSRQTVWRHCMNRRGICLQQGPASGKQRLHPNIMSPPAGSEPRTAAISSYATYNPWSIGGEQRCSSTNVSGKCKQNIQASIAHFTADDTSMDSNKPHSWRSFNHVACTSPLRYQLR